MIRLDLIFFAFAMALFLWVVLKRLIGSRILFAGNF